MALNELNNNMYSYNIYYNNKNKLFRHSLDHTQARCNVMQSQKKVEEEHSFFSGEKPQLKMGDGVTGSMFVQS